MLALYLASLIAGGGLLMWSLAAGGADADADTDAEVHAHGGGGWLTALPFASVTFWTFFLAFFGLTGVALTVLGVVGSAVLTAAIAAGLGFCCGFAVGHVMKRLRRDVVDSSVRALDFVGEVGRVLLPIAHGQPGKVRVQVKGRAVDLIADTDEPVGLLPNAEVVVHQVNDDGSVKVVALVAERRAVRAGL